MLDLTLVAIKHICLDAKELPVIVRTSNWCQNVRLAFGYLAGGGKGDLI